MNEQAYIDRILEAENLTDNLQDEPANLLLHWGTSRVRSSLKDVADDEQAGQRVNAIMAVMRQINRIVGNAASTPMNDSINDLKKLVKLYTRATGASPTPAADPARLQVVASTLASSP